MAVIECNDVSIMYKTGDMKAIGLKEFIMRKLTRNYHAVSYTHLTLPTILLV